MTLCSVGDRCVFFDRQKKTPAELEGSLPVCEGCLSAGDRAVSALPFDYVSLEQLQIPSLGVWGDGQPSAGDEHPIPLNLSAEALQAEIHRVVTTWEEIVRDRDRLSESVTKGVRAGWAVQAAVQILQPRVRLLAAIGPVELVGYPLVVWANPDGKRYRWVRDEESIRRFEGIEYADVPGWKALVDFRRLHDHTRSLLGLISAKHEMVKRVPCRECDLVSLYRVPGDDRVWCGNDECRAIFGLDDFRRWAGLVAEYARGQEVA